MGYLSWFSYLGITSASTGYSKCARDSKLPKVSDYSTYRAHSSSCRCLWEKNPCNPHWEIQQMLGSLQGFYISALADPRAEKDVAGSMASV